MPFYIDKHRCWRQPLGVTKLAVLAKLSKQLTACCSPGAKVQAKDLSSYATLFKALGDDTRLAILGFLATAGDALCVCDIENHVKDLSQPTISHHLRQLREAGLVTAERRGTWIYYAIDKSAHARLATFVALFEA
jgi:ArsR family transcriptional regulator, arsenate/arsenite/antimonite-responsive transcriptional repressor